MKITGFISCAAVLAVSAVAQTPAGSNVPGPDRAFAIRVAETDIAELQVSKMALEKSDSMEVKKVAQKLIEDHTKTTEAMKEIAASKNLPLPKRPDSKHMAMAVKLKSESGKTFDMDYLSGNSTDHHQVVEIFKKEAASGQDPEIKAFAAKFLPGIEEHTEMIDMAKNNTKSNSNGM